MAAGAPEGGGAAPPWRRCVPPCDSGLAATAGCSSLPPPLCHRQPSLPPPRSPAAPAVAEGGKMAAAPSRPQPLPHGLSRPLAARHPSPDIEGDVSRVRHSESWPRDSWRMGRGCESLRGGSPSCLTAHLAQSRGFCVECWLLVCLLSPVTSCHLEPHGVNINISKYKTVVRNPGQHTRLAWLRTPFKLCLKWIGGTSPEPPESSQAGTEMSIAK